MLGGGHIPILGKAKFELQLGSETLVREVRVAEINDEILLGDDILRRDSEGPMDIINSRKVIKFRGQEIPMVTVGLPKRALRVSTIDDEVIPGMAEKIIDVFINRPDQPYDTGVEECMLVEADQDFVNANRCLVTPVVIRATGRVTAQVRLFNPFPEPTLVRGDEMLGELTPVQVEQILKEEEHAEEEGNQSCVRQVLVEGMQGTRFAEQVIRQAPKDGEEMALHGEDEVVPPHMEDLIKRSSEGWSTEEQTRIRKLLIQYQDVFSKHEFDLGRTHLVEHRIDTGDAKPIAQPPRRVPFAFADAEKERIEKMLEAKLVRPSTSPWASPVCLVRKPDGKARVCIDYKKLNAVTIPIQHPMPRVDDCINALSGGTVFGVADATSGYYQVPMREEDIPKTAFTSKYGIFDFLVVPMGLTSAGATFQRLMEMALAGLQWVSCLIYMDDVIVFGRDFDEHFSRLMKVLQRFREAGLKLKPAKCNFFRREAKFLGHVIDAEGVRPDPDNVEKIVNWPVPKNVTEVRGFLGMGNYYRKFIKSYSEKMKPLTNLTRKDIPFEWTEDCEKAFQFLKTALIGPEIMSLPVDEGMYILDTDASLDTIGAVLSQVQGNRERVIAYGSRTLSKTERNYCVTDRELLAVRFFLEYYRQYLLGRKFLVRSDHQALRWLFSLREPKDRIARWLETMSAFEKFPIEYRPGNKHGNADAMSRRCPCAQDCRCPLLEDEEILKCGPCKKCKRRAVLMDSSLMNGEGSLRPNFGALIKSKECESEDWEELEKMVRRCVTGQPAVRLVSTQGMK